MVVFIFAVYQTMSEVVVEVVAYNIEPYMHAIVVAYA
jgi:hypothetical protein